MDPLSLPQAGTAPGGAAPAVEHYARRVMSGQAQGLRAALVRAGLSTALPFYASAVTARNWAFDRGLKASYRLSRPVISVGNITTGGTGKTPVVRWLAGRLRERGRHVAVLARGYGARPGELGDEQLMLERLLNQSDSGERVNVVANPDRLSAARRTLLERPDVDVFVLDDGFQHRRLARDLDIVLINATSPFGYGHMLPRGMLREPLGALRRAGAVVVTHADQPPARELEAIERRVRQAAPAVPIYRAAHEHAALHAGDGSGPHPLDRLKTSTWFAACGIGDPQSFLRQLESVGGRPAGFRWFADHHRYTAGDLADVRRRARDVGADLIVTTEKDWTKLEPFDRPADGQVPVWRVDLRVRFLDGGEGRLWEQVWRAVQAGGRT